MILKGDALLIDQKIALRLTKFISLGILFVELALFTPLSDPVNSPKLIILLLVSLWVIAYSVSIGLQVWLKVAKSPFFILNVIFIFILFFLSVLSQDKLNAFLGEYLRKDGFTTYFSLVIITLILYTIFRPEYLNHFFNMFFLLSIIFGSYAILQSFGKDFIN